MKLYFGIGVLVLAALSSAQAQVASSQSSTQASLPRSSRTQPAGHPVARVNGTILTDLDLLREMYSIFPYARQHNGGFPKELEAGIRDGALKMIIFEELVYQEALRRRMTIAPAKLQTAETEFRSQFSTPSLYQEFVRTEFNGRPSLLRERIRRSLLIDALLKLEVEQKSALSEAELKDYYDKHPARFQYPESFAFQTISVLPPPNATPEQLKEGRKRAEDDLHQAQATKNYEEFGMLAEKLSDDDYRVMMGDHKFVERAKLAPAVVQALLALQPGQITGIIPIEQAYTIVRLNQHVLAGKAKFADVKVPLRRELEARKKNQLRASLDHALRQKAKVELL